MNLTLSGITNEYMNKELSMTLLLTEMKIKKARNGKEYADLFLQDQTQKCEARLWEYEAYSTLLEQLKYPGIVDCIILVGEYKGQVQLTVKSLQPSNNKEITIEQLVQRSKWNADKMKDWLNDYYEFIQAPHIKKLVHDLVFTEPYYEMFCTYPAAKSVHHHYMHGILQHTLEVLKYAKIVAGTKKLTQRQTDRLLAMAFLHDWAKIREYEPVPLNQLTLEGRLLGHIFIGAHETKKVIDTIDGFNQDDEFIIINGILGHHGSFEWGSPVLPKTVEAQILHQADKLSGDVESVLAFMESQGDPQDGFTDRLWNMGTDYYLGGLE